MPYSKKHGQFHLELLGSPSPSAENMRVGPLRALRGNRVLYTDPFDVHAAPRSYILPYSPALIRLSICTQLEPICDGAVLCVENRGLSTQVFIVIPIRQSTNAVLVARLFTAFAAVI